MITNRDELLNCPSMKGRFCGICGKPKTNDHHVVPKGMGGRKNEGATVPLCGMGNVVSAGCHGKVHHGEIILGYEDGWYWSKDGETWKPLRQDWDEL